MEIVNPKVEYWRQHSIDEHVAKCAAVCYKTTKINPTKIMDMLIRNGHHSMLRHYSIYYIIPGDSEAGNTIKKYVMGNIFGQIPYVTICITVNDIFISTNAQFVINNRDFAELLKEYEVSIDEFEERTPDRSLLRYTFSIITSIKVSRELNRVSPNNIAEQSTRYVNFISKNGDVAICSSVDDHLTAVDKAIIAEQFNSSVECYKNLIASGVTPEDARRVLPIDTATQVVYTYSVREWKHILDLRYFETTGKAAPDAKLVAEMIYEKLKEFNHYE